VAVVVVVVALAVVVSRGRASEGGPRGHERDRR